jgi:hypothetical protein
MRTFNVVRDFPGQCRLVEIYVHNGVHKVFNGSTCVADAIRHLSRVCSTDKKFEIVYSSAFGK